MKLNSCSLSPEITYFIDARNALSEAIGREISKDNARGERSGYQTGEGMMLHQIKFHLKCLYDQKYYLNNKREDKKMRYKYRNMEIVAMDYLATLDYLDHSFLKDISGQDLCLSSDIIDSFERELNNHIDLQQATNRRQQIISDILEKNSHSQTLSI